MYRHCIFCHADLGSNESVEHFPIGTRLSFDPERGRLWAICARCRRWNLTPLDTRWEALEECERLFRDTKLRYSTDQIGLARLRSGTELVRIGRPPRPELAAWRYGRHFGERRRRAMLHGGVATGLMGAAIVGGPLILAAGGSLFAATMIAQAYAVAFRLRSVQRIPGAAGERYVVGPNERHHVRISPGGSEGSWTLHVPYLFIEEAGTERRRFREWLNIPSVGTARLEGDAAVHAAGLMLPRMNAGGASQRRVEDAVRFLDESGSPDDAFGFAASKTREWGAKLWWGDTGSMRFLPAPVRLALEMAAHENQERRALEGELRELEADWRTAEELAAIADELVVPEGVKGALDRLKGAPPPA